MGSDRDAFLAHILDAPDDPVPRLVYADWLQENGASEKEIRFFRKGPWTACMACQIARVKLAKAHDGPWKREPVCRVAFMSSGLPCLMHRHDGALNWCGYVGLPGGHPLANSDAGEVSEFVTVHGGWTFDRECPPCVTYDLPRAAHWIGFDCGHGYDYQPGWSPMSEAYGPLFGLPGGDVAAYRTADYVRAELQRAAAELAAMMVATESAQQTPGEVGTHATR